MNAARSRVLRGAAGLALLLVLFVALAHAARAQLWSGFFTLDDEGDLLLGLRHFLEGHPLYDDTFSYYGPFYYLVDSVTYRALGWTPSSETARLLTLATWLVDLALVFGYVLRRTRNPGLAALGAVGVSRLFVELSAAPGHPQGQALTLVLIACALLGSRSSGARATALGLTIAGALLTKINIGVFLLAGVLAAADAPWGGPRIRAASRWGASAAVLLLPSILMRRHLHHETVRWHTLLVTAGSMPLLARGPSALEGRATRALLAGLAVGLAAVAAWTIGTGTTAHGLLRGVLLGPLNFSSFWGFPIELRLHHAVWIVLVTLLPTIQLVARPGWPGPRAAAALKTVFGALVLALAIARAEVALLGYALPLLWIATLEPLPPTWAPGARRALALCALLQALIAYPVAGTQRFLAVVPLVVVGCLALGDALEQAPPSARRGLGVAVGTAGTLAALAVIAVDSRTAWERYDALTPLRVSGAGAIRVSERAAATFGFLAHNLEQDADTVATAPGLGSIYLWANRPAPSGLNTAAWLIMFDGPTQSRIARALDVFPRACAVRQQHLLFDIWGAHAEFRSAPLLRYIDARFVTVAKLDGYELMIGKNRVPPPFTYAAVPVAEAAGRPWSGTLAVSLPALGDFSVAALAIANADGPALAGTLEVRERGALRELALRPLALAQPHELELVCRLSASPLGQDFPLVRLEGADGKAVAVVPIVRPNDEGR